MLLVPLAACGPSIVASAPGSVTVDRVSRSNIGQANELAQNECSSYGKDAEMSSIGSLGDNRNADPVFDGNNKTVIYRCVDRGSAVKPAAATPANPDERKTVTGSKPLFCAPTAVDVGLCFLDEEACRQEVENNHAAGCEPRNAGSCFTTTKTLDHSKLTICAISIKDCEARRQTYTADADYTASACGVYRKE